MSDSSSRPTVLIVGMGAVGSIAAYALTVNGGSEVTCVARSSFDILTTTGFHLESRNYGSVEGFKPHHVAKSIDEAVTKYGPFDYMLIATKNIPDVYPVEDLVAKCYNPNMAVVLLQNGIGLEVPMFKRFPKIHLISGVTMIGATLYGDTVKQPDPDEVTFGTYINRNLPDEESQIAKCKLFVDLYRNEFNEVFYEPNVKFTRWRKLVYNATINTSCALTNVDCGRLDLFGGIDLVARPAMDEVLAIAKADGVELPRSIIELMITSNSSYYPPSMLIDARKDNYTEYITLCKNVVTIAQKYNIPCPTLTVLANLLHVVQMRVMEEKGRFELPEKRPTPGKPYNIEYKY